MKIQDPAKAQFREPVALSVDRPLAGAVLESTEPQQASNQLRGPYPHSPTTPEPNESSGTLNRSG